MKVNEIFESIQGEGKYIGQPALFIRLSGCTRACDFCDTKYHIEGKEMKIKDVVNRIKQSKSDYIVWTGGEPMLQEEEVYEVITGTDDLYHQLETNGDILPRAPSYFSYIAFSPKERKVQKNAIAFCFQLDTENIDWDIKVVTDLKMNKDMIEDATMLMPLSTYDEEKDLKIQQKVWKYCIKHNIKYTPRINVDVWGQRKGI